MIGDSRNRAQTPQPTRPNCKPRFQLDHGKSLDRRAEDLPVFAAWMENVEDGGA